jgi:hypothetical protein
MKIDAVLVPFEHHAYPHPLTQGIEHFSINQRAYACAIAGILQDPLSGEGSSCPQAQDKTQRLGRGSDLICARRRFLTQFFGRDLSIRFATWRECHHHNENDETCERNDLPLRVVCTRT